MVIYQKQIDYFWICDHPITQRQLRIIKRPNKQAFEEKQISSLQIIPKDAD